MAELDFMNARLEDFDNTKPIPQDIYTFKIDKVEPRTYTKKKGPDAGQEGSYLSVVITVVNHDAYSGRRLYEAFFPNAGSLKILSLLSKTLGVPQEDGEDVQDWLVRISQATPPLTFNLPVTVEQGNYKTDADGNFLDENKVQWFGITRA